MPPRRAYSRNFMPMRRKRSKGRQDVAPRTQLVDMCKPNKEKITHRKESFSCTLSKQEGAGLHVLCATKKSVNCSRRGRTKVHIESPISTTKLYQTRERKDGCFQQQALKLSTSIVFTDSDSATR